MLFAARTGALQKLGRRYTVLPIEAKVGGSYSHAYSRSQGVGQCHREQDKY